MAIWTRRRAGTDARTPHRAAGVLLLTMLLMLAASCASASDDYGRILEEQQGPQRSSGVDAPEAETSRVAHRPLPQVLRRSCQVSGKVYAIEIVGDRVFIGGEMSGVWSAGRDAEASVSRRNIAACDLTSGEVLDWYPNGGVEGTVRAFATDGQWLYIGGDFSSVGDEQRSNLARVSLVNGEIDSSWNPRPNAPVRVLQLAEDKKLYVGGVFGRIVGQAQRALARLHRDGTLDTAFAPSLIFMEGSRPGVFTIALADEGVVLYIGGKFATVNGLERTSVAGITASTGTTTLPFAPSLNDSNPDDGVVQVHGVGVAPDFIYLCGDWWETAGYGGTKEDQHNVARFRPEDGSVDAAWLPNIDGGVQSCTLDEAAGAFVLGGHWDFINGQRVPKLAALQLADATAVPFPTANSVRGVYALAIAEGGELAIGGAFDLVAGEDARAFAILEPADPTAGLEVGDSP